MFITILFKITNEYAYFLLYFIPDLKFARLFSTRNGFGPAPIPPSLNTIDRTNQEMLHYHELHTRLSNMTGAVEAAIRMIAPLISIVSLKHTSLASKGNISCVWQRSKLASILPNLPSLCKYIILHRGTATGLRRRNDNIKSTKCKRYDIQRLLILLKSTCSPWTEIDISYENLNAWPEDGDLADVNDVTTINDTMEVTTESQQSNQEDSFLSVPANLELDADGDDTGPAPLQNDVVPDETYEGVINVGDTMTTGGANAMLTEVEISRVVNALRSGTAGTDINMTANEAGTHVTMQQSHVLPTEGFVNMSNTRFAWSMAFPSVY